MEFTQPSLCSAKEQIKIISLDLSLIFRGGRNKFLKGEKVKSVEQLQLLEHSTLTQKNPCSIYSMKKNVEWIYIKAICGEK